MDRCTAVDAGLGHQARVLQVALAPAAVALQLGQQVRRLLLIATDQVAHQPHVVARAAHEGGFHKVVRHDAASQAPFAGDGRQRAVLHERCHADDGVVAPVVRFAQLPVLHAQSEQATRDARGKLLRAGVQRHMADGLRSGLDDAGRGVGFHQLGHGDDAVAAHHAVGVQHHHVAVVLAPAAAEVGHVACLAVGAACAQAVVHLHLGLLAVLRQGAAQLFPGGALGAGNGGVVAVGEHKHIERGAVAGGSHRLAGGAQPGKHGGHVFVADRHDDGSAGVGSQRVICHAACRQRMPVAAQHHPKAHEPGQKAGYHPGGQQRKQRNLAVAQPRVFIVGLHAGKQGAGQCGGQHGEQRKRPAAALRCALPGGGGFSGGLYRRGRCGLLGCTARQAQQHGGAYAVPEAAPGQGHHGAAVQRRCRHRIGVTLFAQRAASAGGWPGVGHTAPRDHGRACGCVDAVGVMRAYSGRLMCVHVSLTAWLSCWRKARSSTGRSACRRWMRTVMRHPPVAGLR